MTLSTSASRHWVWCRSATLCPLVAWPRLVAFALVPVMFVASALAQQEYPLLSRALTVERLPGQPVYYVVGQPGIPGKDNEGHTSNAGFVVTSQGVVVFDALGRRAWAGTSCSRFERSAINRYATLLSVIITPITFTGCKHSRTIVPAPSSSPRSEPANIGRTSRPRMREPIRGSTNVGKRCFPGSIAIHASSRPISLFDNASYSTSAGSASC